MKVWVGRHAGLVVVVATLLVYAGVGTIGYGRYQTLCSRVNDAHRAIDDALNTQRKLELAAIRVDKANLGRPFVGPNTHSAHQSRIATLQKDEHALTKTKALIRRIRFGSC